MEGELKKFFDVACSLTKKAEALIRNRIHSSKKIETKAYEIDFVTETDKEVEDLLITGLQTQFPDHKFIGEESTSEGAKPQLSNSPTWIIDPVDGTMNFVHGNNHVCISIGLCIDKEPVLGIISVPIYNQMYRAIKGQGAFMNDEPIRVSKTTELSKALLCIEGGTSRDPKKVSVMMENILKFLPKIHGYRASGSAAYNMAMVAMGGIDGYFEYGLHAWDMAAGAIIISEAGGYLCDPSGGPFDVMSRRLLCSSSQALANEISQNVTNYEIARDDE